MITRKNHLKDIQKYFLLGTVLFFLTISFFFIIPFLATLFASAVVATIIHPIHQLTKSKIKFSDSFAAFITFLLIVILFLLPLTFFLVSIVGQTSGAYNNLSARINELVNQEHDTPTIFEQYPVLNQWITALLDKNPFSVENIAGTIKDVVKSIGLFLVDHTANIIKQVSLLILHVIIFLISLFYFIRDGKKLTTYIKNLLPLDSEDKTALFLRIENAMNSIVLGMIGAAIAQGIVLGIGFTIIGVQNVIFWAAFGAILSFVPYIGAALVWLPLVLYLFISGDIFSGTFLALWGILLVSNVDNILKPYLIGSRATLHPLAVMIMLLGGAIMFGFSGLILAPLVLTLTLSFLHIYQSDYKKILEEEK